MKKVSPTRRIFQTRKEKISTYVASVSGLLVITFRAQSRQSPPKTLVDRFINAYDFNLLKSLTKVIIVTTLSKGSYKGDTPIIPLYCDF